MFSPYNAKAAALILTGAKSQGVFLASTQVNTEEYFYVQRRCHCGRSELSSL